jgi:hypothetical protein
MNQKEKNRTLFFLGLVILAVVLMAWGLPNLTLQPGMPLPELINQKIVLRNTDNQLAAAVGVGEFFAIIIGFLLLASFLYALYQFIKGAHWRDLKAVFLNYLLTIFLLSAAIMFFILLLPHKGTAQIEELPLETPIPLARSPLGSVPPILLWVAGILLLVILVLAGLWVFTTMIKEKCLMEKIKLEAEKAQRALLTGHDYKDVIIQCYKQMNLAMAQEQKIERQDYMTAREFEAIIKAAGISPAPIHQLTRLFENVRYGHSQSRPEDEQLAIQCLEELIRACSEVKPGA